MEKVSKTVIVFWTDFYFTELPMYIIGICNNIVPQSQIHDFIY